jgi:hypothetical protein
LGLADGFLARPAFFAGLAFLPALRFGFAAAGSGAPLTESFASSLIEFLLDRVAVVTWITQLGRNIKPNLQVD